MDVENKEKIELSNQAKIKYLSKLIGKVLKVLYLIEEEEKTKVSPIEYMKGQLLEINSANELFEGELVTIIVKFNLILINYEAMSFKEKRRQILEINSQINHLLDIKKKA